MSQDNRSAAHFYPKVDPNPDFPAIEEKILAFWEQENIFQRSVEARPARVDGHTNEFIFYDGPPFANGLPHYGHLLTGFVKDLFARYETMKGRRVERRFGWDCHGLPAEMGAEKELGISGRQAITQYGIDKFNAHCRVSVMKYTDEWRWYVKRQARWVDFDGDYKTMDTTFMESVLWAFKQLYDKGLVYEAYRVMPYSWAAETPLSNFETRLDNSYREREDKAVTVAFELNTPPHGAPKAEKYYVLAWTTTPWTLPSNLALAVNRDITYVALPGENKCYIVAESAIGTLPLNLLGETKLNDYIYTKLKGTNLIGLSYHPLFPYFASHKHAFRILDGSDFVTDTDGTGIVHMAPGFGEDDQRVCEVNGIEIVCPVDHAGRYTDEIYDLPFPTEITPPPLAGGAQGGNLRAASTGLFGSLPDTTRNRENMAYAKSMRQQMTDAEWKLWQALSGKQLEGCKFRRQQTIGSYIVDFVCMGKKLIIEIDGGQHAGQTDYDETRTAFLTQAGYRVLRFWNNEVLDNLEGVYDTILQAVKQDPPPAPPQAGGIGEETLRLRGLNVIAENAEKYKFGEANQRIIDYLKKTGQLIKQETIKHNYPHCWRTDTPLIYRALPSWYVEVSKFKDRMVELNQQINWIPGHIKDGMFGKWLENARDWSISRNRFWGTPIPVWRSASGKLKVFGSIAELEAASGQTISDLHRPFIDDIIIHEDGEEYRRVADVFDCWFESGSMPYGQVHYPFEREDWFEHHFPADFIVEYQAQTRGWFYTLMVLATALFDKPPFLNCICHGVVLDDKGQKLSKRLNNYADPKELFEKFGADALRWFMMASPVMRGNELYIDKEGKFIRDVVRLAIKPVWNAYNFFCLYANADGIKANFATGSTDVMDRYILAKCAAAVDAIRTALDAYDTPSACEAISQFFEALNNWYIRRNKERFWKHEHDDDKQAAYDTLYTVLTAMCRAAAPLLPLTLEEIYKGLTGEASVHLANFPRLDGNYDGNLGSITKQMDQVRDICNAALAVRSNLNIRVRQPLLSLSIYSEHELGIENGEFLDSGNKEYYKKLIADELNVKDVHFSHNIDQVAVRKLLVNAREIGKRLGAKTKAIIPAAKKGDWHVVENKDFLGTSYPIKVEVAGEILENNYLTTEDSEVTIEFEIKLEAKQKASAQPLSTNDALVILDTTLTPELEAEGIARDMVRLIQQARKDANLNVSDRIILHLDASEAVQQAVAAHRQYVMEQTLTQAIAAEKPENAVFTSQSTLDDQPVAITFALAA